MKKTLAFLLTLALLLPTCVGTVAMADEIQYQDTFTIAVANDQEIMDGQMNVSNDVVLPQVYSYLVKRDLEGNIVGDVAESWEVSEDELTWTFHLRKGVKFHSGKELTAEDVKATYDRLLNKEDPVRYTQTMGFIDHCDIVDDYTINLVTLEPAGPMLASLTLRANTLLNKDYIEKYGKELGKEVESVDGTGPFKLVEWNKDEDMHLVRFDDYFNGPAATENICIQIVPEAASRAIAMESHQVDAAISISAEDVLRFKEDDTLNVFSIPGPRLPSVPVQLLQPHHQGHQGSSGHLLRAGSYRAGRGSVGCHG